IIKESYNMGVRRFVTEFWYTGTGDYRVEIKNSRKFIEEKFNKALEK
ncbi:L-ribulose-5-phosphate 4-epimerase, partial [Clostridium perfringens]|nr:L-ribulose-5-phosphate 4-epimerase [Clostridium perfringens]